MNYLDRVKQLPGSRPCLKEGSSKVIKVGSLMLRKDLVIIFSALAVLSMMFLLPLGFVHGGMFLGIFFGAFAFGFSVSLVAFLGVRKVERMRSKKRRSIREIQDRVINNMTANMMDDLNQLIDLHMAAKNFDAAEIYSRQLCKVVDNSDHKVDEWMVADFCNMATPEHVRSFYGKFIFIYRAQGPLCLSDKMLIFKPTIRYSKNAQRVEIPLEDIRSITKGSYSRSAKPIRLDYLEITFKTDGIEEGIVVTPMEFYSDTVWDANKHVDRWHQLIEEARMMRIKRIGEDRAARLAQLYTKKQTTDMAV